MTSHDSPETLVRDQLDELSAQLPGVREGSNDAIHDARVATRRLREALPLLGSSGRERERARRWLKKTGQGLGRIRDLDVMLDLAIATVRRLPAAAVPLQHLLLELRGSRDARLRRAVKRLEREDREPILAILRPSRRATWRLGAGRAPWTDILADRILQRADVLETAVTRAGGVNFPRRVHAVRIAAKKLRYALEAADVTATNHLSGAMTLLKHVQDVLGDLHDRHVFMQTVEARAAEAGPEHGSAFDAVRAYVETECRDLHRRYLEERADLVTLCGAARSAVRRRRHGLLAAVRRPVFLAAAGALALPSAVRLLKRAG
ncbi:MAG: CHAD domain-containing protein [Vicinamibacterales bacterium]